MNHGSLEITNKGSKEKGEDRRRHTVGPREPVSGVVFLSLSFDARTELLLGPGFPLHYPRFALAFCPSCFLLFALFAFENEAK